MKVRHTGIVVDDLVSETRFYRDILGLKVLNRQDEDDEFIRKICDAIGAHISTVKLGTVDGGVIELLHQSYNSKSELRCLFERGISHIAFTVKDLDSIYNKLPDACRYLIKSSPTISPDGSVKVMFCHDFEGNHIELVEELKSETKKILGYIDTIYDEKVRPQTKYPFQLANYLFHRFGMKGGDRLLDVGCGRGDLVRAFRSLGLDARGLDRERSQAHADIPVKYADVEDESFPFGDKVFDVVFSKSLIEHLFDPANFLKECFTVLKPGGRIILMTPDWNSQAKIFFDDYTHRQPYTVTAVRDILKIFGFQRVNSEIFYQLPILWKYPALKIVSQILKLCVPVTMKSRIKFIRWSVELMVLGTGVKR